MNYEQIWNDLDNVQRGVLHILAGNWSANMETTMEIAHRRLPEALFENGKITDLGKHTAIWANMTPLERQQQARIAALEAGNVRLREATLERDGLLLCVRSWLRGDLSEATAQQFIEQISALESETPDAN